ncbi:MAG: Phosphoserine aminotransferase (EC [uncultured Caballeronia sp.]|nr:MAG: Phosphoserine aminotransferase (EC [uncultured Caballeronia sp.]
MSSNLLAALLDIDRYAMIYAHAQKNLGPTGVTVVILRDEFARSTGHACVANPA